MCNFGGFGRKAEGLLPQPPILFKIFKYDIWTLFVQSCSYDLHKKWRCYTTTGKSILLLSLLYVHVGKLRIDDEKSFHFAVFDLCSFHDEIS